MGYDEHFEFILQQIADIESMIVLGESFSGPLAVRLADRLPDRVRAMVLSVTFIECPIARVLARYLAVQARWVPTSSVQVRWLLSGWNAPRELVDRVKSAIRANPRATLARRIRAAAELDDSQILARTKTPLLYLQADHDALVRKHCLRRILELRPDAVVKIFQTSHLLLQTQPRQAWDAIEAFLESIGGQTAVSAMKNDLP